MQNENFFERLLLLPLFQGIGRGDFMEIVWRIRLGFNKKSKGDVLVHQDELCTGLYFILQGDVLVKKRSDQNNYEICEWLNMPMVLQPESLFGLSTRYTRTFVAESDVQILRIEKDAVRDILFNYPTFRINYLNLLSTRIQLANRMLWHGSWGDLSSRFVQFLSERCLRPAGRKELRIDMKCLGVELLATRLNVSRMLNAMEEQGKLILQRGRIIVPNMEKLIM